MESVCAICLFDIVNFAQAVFVGGLFPQFHHDVVDQAGVRYMAAVQMAINKVNNKTDGVYDNLLPNTQVCYDFSSSL